jgi:hypothetical protein
MPFLSESFLSSPHSGTTQPILRFKAHSVRVMNVARFIGACLLIHCVASAEVIRFDRSQPGRAPDGWTIAMTHAGGPPEWQVLHDDSGPRPRLVFAQTSRDAMAGRFPLAIWEKTSIRNGEVSVAFKPVDGAIDRAAGIVWRYQDQNNYYIVRANALENNVVLYRVENGVRLSIAPKGQPSRAYGVKHEIPSGHWNTLRVEFTEGSFVVFLNAERLFEAEDRTFPNAGKVGLWTKADSLTYFDEFTVTEK